MHPIHLLPAVLLAAPVLAQPGDLAPKLNCDNNNWNSRQSRACEIREHRAGAMSRIAVDGQTNGGISIRGWNRPETWVRAKVETWAPTEGEAKALASQVHVQQGNSIRADASTFTDGRGWAVSYEIFVPQTTDLSLKAHNGGIAIANMRSAVEFEAVNGGVSLKGLGGTVRGKTQNGGLSVELNGSRWEGDQMDISATNGGVSLTVPEHYSARLETSTVNGRISVDHPLVAINHGGERALNVTLGSGGSLIRAVTTNGGVSVRRRP